MFCPKCGNQLDEHCNFCDKCGTKIRTATEKKETGRKEIREEGKKIERSLVWGMAGIVAACSLLVIFIGSSRRHTAESEAISESGIMADTRIKSEDELTESTEGAETSKGEDAIELERILSSAQVGDKLQFGAYEQDNNLENEAEAITWMVLAKEEDRILLFSEYVLEMKKELVSSKENFTWSTSSTRTWLNEEFFSEAFSSVERDYIIQSQIGTPDTEDRDGADWQSSNPLVGNHFACEFQTYGGPDTRDYIFLLSYEETLQYVPEAELRATPTKYALQPKYFNDYEVSWSESVDWMLRSPGQPNLSELDYKRKSEKFVGYATGFRLCLYDGSFFHESDWHKDENGLLLCPTYRIFTANAGKAGVRPAMWVRL